MSVIFQFSVTGNDYPITFMTDYDIDRYLNIRSAYAPTFGPEGETLSFLMDTTGSPQVWTLEEPGEWPEQYTFYDDGISFATWSPAERCLIFGKDRGGNERVQFYLLRESDLTIDPLTDRPAKKHLWGGWDSTGSKFAFSSNRRDGSRFDAYVQYVEDGTEAKCVCEGRGWLHVNEWSPDDERLLLTDFQSNSDQYLYIHNLETGETRRLTPESERCRYLYSNWGPGGEYVYTATDRETDTLSLARIDVSKGQVDILRNDTNWNVDGLMIHQESGRMVFQRNVDGYSDLSLMQINGDSLEELKGPDLPEGVVGSMDFDPAGEQLALTLTGATRNANLYNLEIDTGRTDQWTRASTAGIPRSRFQNVDLVRFESFDGRNIPAFFTEPETVGGDTFPVIVDIHGGPESQRRPSFRSLRQYFVHHGYGVFEPNVRGSSGYGIEYMSLDNVEKRMDSVKDIRAGVEWLGEREEVDPDRIAAYGGSYGGFMVLASLTKYPDLWAAGVDVVGIANFVTFLENTGEWRRKHREAEYGSLEEDREFLEEISPINHVEDIQAPLLVLHGENDPRVPVGEAEQIVEKVRERGVPVEKLIFPDEGHGFQKLENRKKAYRKVVEFLDRYVFLGRDQQNGGNTSE